MQLNAVATNRFFKGLKCPYTGKAITVRVVAHGKSVPMYFSPDAFDPSIPLPTVDELLMKASTRNGIIGYMPPGKERTCPYTGKELKLVKRGDGFAFDGGFSPSTPNKDPYDLGRKLLMRDGKFTGDEAMFVKSHITTSEREPEERPTPRPTEPSDEAMAAVEPLVTMKLKRPTMVVNKPIRKGK